MHRRELPRRNQPYIATSAKLATFRWLIAFLEPLPGRISVSIIYVIEAIRFDRQDEQVARVRWGTVDTDRNVWLDDPRGTDVIDVVNKVMAGTDVWSVVSVDAHTVPGPKVRVIANARGIESIELANDYSGPQRTIRDLRRF
jgi:hypothetical protein